MDKILTFGPNEITKALSDAKFFEQMPEFASLKVKMETMKANQKKGCVPCRARRIISSVNADFMRIVPTLSDQAKERLKKYYGVDTIKYNKVDRIARKVETVSF